MDDLISRRAAIKEIVQNVLHDKEGKCSVFGALLVLENLPTAEPDAGMCWGCYCPKMPDSNEGEVDKGEKND